MRPLPAGFAPLLVAAAVVTSAPCARADDDAPRTEVHWYGYETLALDGAAFGFAALAAREPSENITAPGAAAIGTYLLGGPLVHVANGEWGRAAASLLLRVGAPVVGATTATSPVAGATVGLLGAVAIDAAVLAHHTVEVKEVDDRTKVRLDPDVDVRADRATSAHAGLFRSGYVPSRVTLGVHGTF